MKKGMLVALMMFAVLFVSACGSAQVQTQPAGVTPAADTADNFVVADHFTLDNTKVNFYAFGKKFNSWFLDKTEDTKNISVPRPYCTLLSPVTAYEILVDIGDETKAEVTMAGIYEMLKLQPNGEGGVGFDELVTDGLYNFFYVRDVNGLLRVISMHYTSEGWIVNANSIEKYPFWWLAGNRVFSR